MTDKFRFAASTVFLTYSQTPGKLTPDMLLAKISEKVGVEQYLIAQERHEDLGYHLHAYFKFDKKLDTRDPRFFDVKYYRVYHPNVQRVKRKYSLWRYIKKSGSYITSGFESRPAWQVVLEDNDTEHDFLTDIMFRVGRLDNYAGYRSLIRLWEIKQEMRRSPEEKVREYLENFK